MARPRPVIYVELTALELNGTQASRAWVRATEILLRAKARRDAKLNQPNETPNPQTGEQDE